MLGRLGNVLYWAGCIFSVIIVGVGLYIWSVEPNARKEPLVFILVIGGLAVVGWAIGWAFRYVLAGPQAKPQQTARNTRSGSV